MQLRAGFELQPRAPQLLHEDRWETGSRVDAFDHPPAAAAVAVERATPHVGQLGTTRVRGHEAHTTDSREHDRLAAGIVVPPRLRAPPCDTTECVPQLRDHEHDRDRDDRELERETAAEQPKDAPRRATAAAEPGDLEERPEHGQRQERGHEQPARAPQQTAVCEAGRDERARLIAVDEVVDPVEPARVAGGDRRRDRPGEVQREGPVVGVERIVERRARIESMARLDVHEAGAGSRVDLECARQRDFATQRRDRLARRRVEGERSVAHTWKDDPAVIVGGNESAERRRQPR